MILWIFSSMALCVIAITMLVRANDLRLRKGWNWISRFIGFILAGAFALANLIYEFSYNDWPNLFETVFRIGIMLVFVTTPNLPPWWEWIRKGTPKDLL